MKRPTSELFTWHSSGLWSESYCVKHRGHTGYSTLFAVGILPLDHSVSCETRMARKASDIELFMVTNAR